MNPPRITDILLVPGLAGTIAIGLVVDGQQIAWGRCEPAGLATTEALAKLQTTIGPALRGRFLTSFRELAARLEELRERVTVTIQPPPGQTPEAGVTRRALLTGRFHPTPTQPPSRQEIVEQAPHPTLRYAASQAVLQAIALAQRRSPVEVLADEYALDIASEPPPAWVSLGRPDANSTLPSLPHWPPLAALGFHTTETTSELGEGGVLLQRAIRHLKEALSAWEHGAGIGIGLHAQGAVGHLFNNQPGQMLGALYGLHHAARPYPLWISDPVLLEEPAAQHAAMNKLKTLMRARRMDVQLVAVAHVNSATDITAFVQGDAADAFLLDAPKWGSLHNLMTGIQACREANRPVILTGDQQALALSPALQPAMLALSVDELAPVYDELGRSLAWLALRAGRLP